MRIDSCNRPLGVWTGRPGGLRSDGRRQAPSERCCCVSQSSHDDTAGSPGMYRRVCDGIHNPSNRRQTKPREHTSVTLRVSTHTQTYRLAANRPMTTVIQRITHATAYAIRPAIQPHASRIRHDMYAPTCTVHYIGGRSQPNDAYPSRFACENMHNPHHGINRFQRNPETSSSQPSNRFQQQCRFELPPSPSPDRSQCPASQSVLNPTANMATCDSGTPSPDRSPCPT